MRRRRRLVARAPACSCPQPGADAAGECAVPIRGSRRNAGSATTAALGRRSAAGGPRAGSRRIGPRPSSRTVAGRSDARALTSATPPARYAPPVSSLVRDSSPGEPERLRRRTVGTLVGGVALGSTGHIAALTVAVIV